MFGIYNMLLNIALGERERGIKAFYVEKKVSLRKALDFCNIGADLGGGCKECTPPPPWVVMWFIGVEVEQETSAPPPKENPGSAPVIYGQLVCS